MQQALLDHLKIITEEEQRILDGMSEVDKGLYTSGQDFILNQFTRHEILPARKDDIVINFMVLPEFFDVAYTMAGNNNVLADFLVNVLRQDQERGEYLHFRVAEVLQIQKHLENIFYTNDTGK